MKLPTTIAVIDDDADHLLIARLVLGQVAPGAVVPTFGSRDAFIEGLPRIPLDALALIDRRLGPVESFGLLSEVGRARPDLRLVMLSSALSPVDRARALHAGAIDACEKPASIAGWRDLLDALVGGHEAARAA